MLNKTQSISEGPSSSKFGTRKDVFSLPKWVHANWSLTNDYKWVTLTTILPTLALSAWLIGMPLIYISYQINKSDRNTLTVQLVISHRMFILWLVKSRMRWNRIHNIYCKKGCIASITSHMNKPSKSVAMKCVPSNTYHSCRSFTGLESYQNYSQHGVLANYRYSRSIL